MLFVGLVGDVPLSSIPSSVLLNGNINVPTSVVEKPVIFLSEDTEESVTFKRPVDNVEMTVINFDVSTLDVTNSEDEVVRTIVCLFPSANGVYLVFSKTMEAA